MVEFPFEQAEQIANEILNQTGRKTISATEIPLAGNVSFNEAMLRVAAIHKRTVQFRYAKQNEGAFIESRRLNPEQLTGSGDAISVIGQDPDRTATRRFRLDRIKGEVSFA